MAPPSRRHRPSGSSGPGPTASIPQDLGALLRRVAPTEIPDPSSGLATALFEHLAGPNGLTAHHATFGRREVLQALAEALPPGADVGPIVELADAFLASRHVVPLREASGLRTADVIRRRDGVIVATRVDEARWTTREILDVEDRLVRSAKGRRHDRAGLADAAATKEALAARPELSREQTQLVQRLTRSGAGVEVVEGAAGTGKTFALDAARQAWEATGYRVIGCSLAARAALQLQEGSGIRSVTLDRLLGELDRSGPAVLGTNNVVVVDEAAIVGTRKLAKLLDHAEAAHAKVVLVGDHHQLPEIDAGGAFAGLASRLGSIKLNENRRQRADWERRALSRLRAGSTDRALAAYQAHGRVHLEPDIDAARHRLVSDWVQARRAGGSHAMLAQQRRDVDELNRIAREHLRAEGHIGPEDTLIGGRAFAIGDEVLATRNDYDLDVLNGTRATITAIDEANETVRACAADGREIAFPSEYLQGREPEPRLRDDVPQGARNHRPPVLRPRPRHHRSRIRLLRVSPGAPKPTPSTSPTTDRASRSSTLPNSSPTPSTVSAGASRPLAPSPWPATSQTA